MFIATFFTFYIIQFFTHLSNSIFYPEDKFKNLVLDNFDMSNKKILEINSTYIFVQDTISKDIDVVNKSKVKIVIKNNVN